MRALFGQKAGNRRISSGPFLTILLVALVAPLPAAAAKGGTTSGACRPKSACQSTSGDTTAPTVSITSPNPGATVSGSVSVSGTSSDNTAVSTVELSVDGGAFHPVTGTTSWNHLVDSAPLADGSHTFTARATDTSGNRSSTSVTVTVDNVVEAPADTQAPNVAIGDPNAGATVSGSVNVSGSASDNAGVAQVEIRVDGGNWVSASGTSNWSRSLDTAAYSDGSHTITARATDAAGNASTTSRSVTFDNAPEPTPSPTSSPSTAPNTQGTWTSPEGVRFEVNSAGPWTIAEIYKMVKDNATGPGDFATIAPKLTVRVVDGVSTMAYTSASTSNGVYTNFTARIDLAGVNSNFANRPDASVAHEYGHVWSMYHLHITKQKDWSSYLNARWSTADGSTTLATDSRLDSSYSWSRGEIFGDDYRLLFGTNAAITQRPAHMTTGLVDPRQVPHLRSFLVNEWTAK